MATPICRCRVLYLGSAVPHVTKDGLHGIQEPLRELYPEEGVLGAKGIDSWLSVWSNGLLLENVDEKRKRVTRFLPIESLHYCAAVRHVTIPGPDGKRLDRFLPLDSPFARVPSANNPPLFACILRRTSGIKVLECHSFVCKKEMAANALVRCCFHSYADNMYAKHLETGSIYGSVGGPSVVAAAASGGGAGAAARSQLANGGNGTSTSAGSVLVNPFQKVEQWRTYVNNHSPKEDSDNSQENGELVSIYDGDENHKVWAGATATAATDDHNSIYADYMSTLRSSKSLNTTQRSNRPRQLTAPPSPPPPPPPPRDVSSLSSRNGRHRPSSSSSLSHHRRFLASEFRPMMHLVPPPMRGGMMPPPPPPPHHGMPMPIALHHPPPPHMISGKLYRKRPKNNKKMNGVVPFMTVQPPPPPPPPPMSYSPMPMNRVMGPPMRSTEGEPICLPPKSFYMGHPHQAHVHAQPHSTASLPSSAAQKPSKYKKLHKSTNSLVATNNNDESNSSNANNGNSNGNAKGGGGSDTESKFNTGIYKKKGHLNERAFSYSIRQEHRSRSHSSLSTLNFNGSSTPQPSNGLTANGKEDHHHQSTPAINGHNSPAINGNKSQSSNGHGNGIATNGTGSNHNSETFTKGTSGTLPSTTNGVRNMMNDLSLSDDVHIDQVGSSRERNPVSRKRIVAAANNHR